MSRLHGECLAKLMKRSQSCAVLRGRTKSGVRNQSPQRQRTRQNLRHGRQAGFATKTRLRKSPVLQRPQTSPVNTQVTYERQRSHHGGTTGPISRGWATTTRSAAGQSATRSMPTQTGREAARGSVTRSNHKALQQNASVSVLAKVWQPPRHRIVQSGAKTQSVHLRSSAADNDYHFRTFDKISYRTQPVANVRQKVARAKSGEGSALKTRDASRQMQRGKRVTPHKFDEHFDKGPVLERSDCGVWYDPHPDNTLASVAKARPANGIFDIRPRKKKFAQTPDGKIKRYKGGAAGGRKESAVGKRHHGLLRKQLRFQISDLTPKQNEDAGEPIWKQHSDYMFHESTISRPAVHTRPTRIKTNAGGVRVMHAQACVYSGTLDGHPLSSTVAPGVHDSLAYARQKYVPTPPYRISRDAKNIKLKSAVQDATRAMNHTASSQRKLARTLKRTNSCPSNSLLIATEGAQVNVKQQANVTGRPTSKSNPDTLLAVEPPIRSGFPLHHSESHVNLNKRPATVSGTVKPRNSYFGRLFEHAYAQRPRTEYGTRKQNDLQLFRQAHHSHGSRAWHQMENDSAIREPAKSDKPVVLRSTGNPEHGLCYFHE